MDNVHYSEPKVGRSIPLEPKHKRNPSRNSEGAYITLPYGRILFGYALHVSPMSVILRICPRCAALR